MTKHSSVSTATQRLPCIPALLTAAIAFSCQVVAADLAYVIPTKGMIERGLVYVVRRAIDEAIRENAKAVIFDINTPGGRLDAAEEIINIIGNSGIPTYAYVNPNAISAGAIIAISTDKIYMAPGSRIGDAMPMMLSPLGSPQEMPRSMEEKAMSYTASLIRSAAQRKGHDTKLAEAMVRPQGYTIGDEVICPTNQLLTLTNIEAERMVGEDDNRHPLLSSGTVTNMADLLQAIGMGDAKLKTFAVSPAERIARYIEMFSVIFLAGGLLGLYIEFKTPGFGFPGISGITLLAIWFWGYHVAGLAGAGEMLVFLLGAALLLIEIFVIPGFGITGIAGIAIMLASLIMAMTQHYPGGHWHPPADQLQHAIATLSSSIVITFFAGLALARFLPSTPIFGRLSLSTEQCHQNGYQSSADSSSLAGLRGIAATPLRPAGIGKFGDRRIDVVTRAEFIEAGRPIVIAETHGNRIIVVPADQAP